MDQMSMITIQFYCFTKIYNQSLFPPLAFSRLLSSLVAPPSLKRPNCRVDWDTARGDRRPDDRRLSEPELGCPAGPCHADAGGLRTGDKPANAHRQGAAAPGQLSPTQWRLLPHRRPQAARQQADGPAAVPSGNQLLYHSPPPQRTATVHVPQYPQERVAAVTAKHWKHPRL